MVPFRSYIAVALLAVAINSVGAAPCCCTLPVEVKRGCCEKVQKAAADHACCAKKLPRTDVAKSGKSCCCIESRPVSSTTPESAIKRVLADQLVADDGLSFHALPQVNVTSANRIPGDDIFLYGPRLLALHCIWLN